jgi:hypothetical protein
MTGSWLELAACGGSAFDPTFDVERDPFYPKDGDYAEAKWICASCPVRQECGEDAVESEYGAGRHGMRAGMTPEQRYDLARGRARKTRRSGQGVNRLTVEEHQHRIELYEEGWSDIRIGAYFGVSSNAIKAWRNHQNPPLPSKQAGVSNEVRATRERMWREGATDAAIARATQGRPEDVSKWRSRKGYPVNPSRTRVSA